MSASEPAGSDLAGGLIRRTSCLGAATRWACGEHPQDCLQDCLRERYPLIPGLGWRSAPSGTGVKEGMDHGTHVAYT